MLPLIRNRSHSLAPTGRLHHLKHHHHPIRVIEVNVNCPPPLPGGPGGPAAVGPGGAGPVCGDGGAGAARPGARHADRPERGGAHHRGGTAGRQPAEVLSLSVSLRVPKHTLRVPFVSHHSWCPLTLSVMSHSLSVPSHTLSVPSHTRTKSPNRH